MTDDAASRQSQSAHFNPGQIDVAFIFSAPGTIERDMGRPVSGITGENLDFALVHLSKTAPELFQSENRYDYRITNSYPHPLSHPVTRRSEPTATEVDDEENLSRVLREVKGCRLVVLCGVKAQRLKKPLEKAGFTVVNASHTSNRALRTKHNLTSASTPLARRKERVQLWASALLLDLPKSLGRSTKNGLEGSQPS